MSVAIVYAIYGNRAAAEAATRLAIGKELAACANIMAPCTSVYRWEGEVRQEEEVPVLFKTSLARRGALIAELALSHDYQVPAVLSWDAAETHWQFARWVEEQTGGAG
jgi:periplasmic divalent cation tolerance protein